MQLHMLGIDLGKTVFHLVGFDSTGKVVIRKSVFFLTSPLVGQSKNPTSQDLSPTKWK